MPRLTCGVCSVSRSFDGYRRWCDACRAYFEPSDLCKYPTTEHMIYAQDWYADLVRRLTEAIAVREAEANAVR